VILHWQTLVLHLTRERGAWLIEDPGPGEAPAGLASEPVALPWAVLPIVEPPECKT